MPWPMPWVQHFIAALMLLTRLPVARWAGPTPVPLAGTLWAWPLVGAALGAATGAIMQAGLAMGLPPLLAAAWALAALLLATGALHEDGLADTADGIFGGRTPARRLEIMRDSRIGSYGALALGLSLLLRATAMAALARHPIAAFAAAGALSRAAIFLPLLLTHPARNNGLAAALGTPPRATAFAGLALALLIALLLLPLRPALGSAAAAALCGWGLAALSRRAIGGHTGDILGASAVLAECAALTVLAAN